LAVAAGLLLVAAYPAAASAATVGHWALDETSGNTVVDSSGFHNDGTSQNMTLDQDGVTGDPADRAYLYDVSFPTRTGNLGTVKKGKELTIGWGSDGTDFFHGTLDDVEIDIG